MSWCTRLGLRRLVACSGAAAARPFRTCIVGSGPAAFYTAKHLLKDARTASIHLVERLPTPFGLVRSGVAPDHPDTKVVANDFQAIASSNRVEFKGNVHVGRDVSVGELLQVYDAVVLACGAESEKTLNIPGEHLRNIYSARAFVNWYNGHPDFAKTQQMNVDATSAVVIGHGNVALDVSRILCSDPDHLCKTDITSTAMEVLRQSSLQHVYVAGRRGPVQAAFTNKELREVVSKCPFQVRIRHDDLTQLNDASREEMNHRAVGRKMKILEQALPEVDVEQHSDAATRLPQLHLRFLLRPVRFLPDADRPDCVGAVEFERTRLEGAAGRQKAVPTGELETVKANLVLLSVGYRSVPLEGVPFDYGRGVVPNVGGRVVDNTDVVPRLFVSGWLKRGPSGIIGTNIGDAAETAQCILEDVAEAPPSSPEAADRMWETLQRDRGIHIVSMQEWSLIDTEEKTRGAAKGKTREKIISREEMIDIAKQRT